MADGKEDYQEVAATGSGKSQLGGWMSVIEQSGRESQRKQAAREETLRQMLPDAKAQCVTLSDEELLAKYTEFAGWGSFYPEEKRIYTELAEYCRAEVLRRMQGAAR